MSEEINIKVTGSIKDESGISLFKAMLAGIVVTGIATGFVVAVAYLASLFI